MNEAAKPGVGESPAAKGSQLAGESTVELVRRVRAGDREALDTLVRRHGPLFRRWRMVQKLERRSIRRSSFWTIRVQDWSVFTSSEACEIV